MIHPQFILFSALSLFAQTGPVPVDDFHIEDRIYANELDSCLANIRRELKIPLNLKQVKKIVGDYWKYKKRDEAEAERAFQDGRRENSDRSSSASSGAGRTKSD